MRIERDGKTWENNIVSGFILRLLVLLLIIQLLNVYFFGFFCYFVFFSVKHLIKIREHRTIYGQIGIRESINQTTEKGKNLFYKFLHGRFFFSNR